MTVRPGAMRGRDGAPRGQARVLAGDYLSVKFRNLSFRLFFGVCGTYDIIKRGQYPPRDVVLTRI
jgi:hypothetical protein